MVVVAVASAAMVGTPPILSVAEVAAGRAEMAATDRTREEEEEVPSITARRVHLSLAPTVLVVPAATYAAATAEIQAAAVEIMVPAPGAAEGVPVTTKVGASFRVQAVAPEPMEAGAGAARLRVGTAVSAEVVVRLQVFPARLMAKEETADSGQVEEWPL
jgi:hypothetical protein